MFLLGKSGGNGVGRYLSVIPDNPVCMIKINVGNLLNESEILENSMVKTAIKASTRELPEQMSNLLNKMVENPNESGFDVNQPAVMVIEDVKGEKGMMLLALSDVRKFEDMLDCFSEGEVVIENVNGINVIKSFDDEVSIAYDKEKLLFAYSEDENADAVAYFNSQEPKAIDNAKLKDFLSNSDDAGFYLSGDLVYTAMMEDADMMMLGANLESLKECSYQLVLNSENGYAELTCDIDCPAEYREMYEKIMQKSSKKHLKYVPETAMFVVDMGCNLENILDIYPEDVKGQLNEVLGYLGFDSSLFKSLSGDVTFAMLQPELVGRSEEPQFMLVMDCDSQAIFDTIITLARQLQQIDEVEENVYAMNLNKYNEWDYNTYESTEKRGGYDYYLAYKDNMLFFVPENVYADLKSGSGVQELRRNAMDNSLVSSMSNGFVFDVQNLLLALDENRKGDAEIISMLSEVESINFEMETVTRMTAKVTLEDKSVNFLRFVVDKAFEVMMLMGM